MMPPDQPIHVSSSPDSPKVVVIGQGYVGLSLAVHAVDAGAHVVGIEVDPERLAKLRRGHSYVDDVSNAQLSAMLDGGRYLPSDDLGECAGFAVAVITVPTPLREGLPDLSYIEASAQGLAPHLTSGATVILESTTYPGTTTELVGPMLHAGSGLSPGTDFHLGYSPERIDPGNRSWGLTNTPKVVSGVDDASLAVIRAFYDQMCDKTIPVSSPAVAEMAKLLENTFRHVNIALVNELAVFANELGIDVWEAVDAASTKPFGFMPFRPGPGVGGHCLPVDPSYLSWKVRRSLGRSFRFVELANDVNEHMPDYVAQRLLLAFNRIGKAISGSTILILGLAYKPNTADARESPAITVADRLVALGAHVRAADPHVEGVALDSAIVRVEATEEEVRAADAVVLLVDHDVFDLQAIAATASFVFDTRNRLRGHNVERL